MARSGADPVGDLKITSSGYCSSRFGFGAHLHQKESEFHFLTKAGCSFRDGKKQIFLPDLSLVFSEPQSEHSVSGKSPGRSVNWFYVRFVPRDLLCESVALLKRVFGGRPFVRMGTKHVTVFEDIVGKLRSDQPLLRRSGEHQFHAFVCELEFIAQSPRLVDAGHYVEKATTMMRNAIYGQLELPFLARELGIDKAYLVRLFKLKTGAPPMRYLRQLKVETSMHLLRQTNMPVKAISAELGFCDEFYFSRAFKQHVGLAPKDFRKRECQS